MPHNIISGISSSAQKYKIICRLALFLLKKMA